MSQCIMNNVQNLLPCSEDIFAFFLTGPVSNLMAVHAILHWKGGWGKS